MISSILPRLALVFLPAVLLLLIVGCSKSSANRSPAASSATMDFERADYKIKIPQNCTVAASTLEVDADHYTAFDLPNGTILAILVIDDKNQGETAFDKLTDTYKSKLTGPVQSTTDMFNARPGKSNIISGKLNGVQFCFEEGMFSGKKKSFILACEYQQLHPDETREILRRVLDSFVIKE